MHSPLAPLTGMAALPHRQLVLLGAGHAHLHVLRMWSQNPIPGVGLTVVNDSSHAVYSGMFPGLLAGLYSPTEVQVDLWQFVPACGARLIIAPVQGLDSQTRRIHLPDRPPLPFDAASVALGSQTSPPPLASHSPRLIVAKPLGTLPDRLTAALTGLRATAASGRADAPPTNPGGTPSGGPPGSSASTPLRVLVVGGGAAGVELTLALQRWLADRHPAPLLTLVDSNPQILTGYSAGTRATALRTLAERGIQTVNSRRVESVDSGGELGSVPGPPLVLHCSNPATQARDALVADLVLWVTSATPPSCFRHFDLPRDDAGFLAIHPTLQSLSGQPVFVVGDSAGLVSQPVRKAGVYAVRQGPILWQNLQRHFAGHPLRLYRPQSTFLSLLSLADGRAIADYRGLSFTGRAAWWLKDTIDRRFLRQYQPPLRVGMKVSSTPASISREGLPAVTAMRCTGCGSKVSAEVLAGVLQRLQPTAAGTPASPIATTPSSTGGATAPTCDPTSPGAKPPVTGSGAEFASVATGSAAPDDAVLLDRGRQPVDVWSVDFFPAFLDDPHLVGRIAALHALSDVWAMGAEPHGALAIVSVPGGDPRSQSELLFQLLAGSLRELVGAGASLLGGHTLEADQLQVGFSVVGRLSPGPAWRRGGLQPGDQLILTKPLGTGAILAGLTQHRATATAVDAALANMLQSNASAARCGRRWPVSAATDITGFGLAGHLLEMLNASQCDATLTLEHLPILPGFDELARGGLLSSLDPANRTRAQSQLHLSPGLDSHPRWPALFDPQTSGGLLLACPASHTPALLRDLHAAGLLQAACIGQVTAASRQPRLSLRP